ncbi:hypothetical protein MHBO_000749 [Bonamia ostreae]|uniref:Uncharacterized protein n=1 Tax=Bonamia ostreae TaxID=126728 RepID=A0ABV2AHC2_9EUKA
MLATGEAIRSAEFEHFDLSKVGRIIEDAQINQLFHVYSSEAIEGLVFERGSY